MFGVDRSRRLGFRKMSVVYNAYTTQMFTAGILPQTQQFRC